MREVRRQDGADGELLHLPRLRNQHRLLVAVPLLNANDLSGWGPLAGELEQPYMQKVYAILRHRKDSGEAIYPEDDVFAAVRLTKLKDVRVVIVGQDPYSTCKVPSTRAPVV